MRTYTRPFRVSDFIAFEPIEPLVSVGTSDPEFVQAIEDSGLAVTGIRDGEIIGCAGVHPVIDDDFNGDIWLRLSPDCLEHKISTLLWIKEGLKIIEEAYPFGQLNATIRSCFESSIKMIEHLGFKRTREVDEWLIYSKRIAV